MLINSEIFILLHALRVQNNNKCNSNYIVNNDTQILITFFLCFFKSKGW